MTEASQTVAAGQLRALIERVERVEGEIADLNADKSEIYKEARGLGFDVKAMRKVVAARKLDPSEREERDAMFDLYWSAIHGSAETEPRARAHVREIIEEFDAETGDIPHPTVSSSRQLVNAGGDDLLPVAASNHFTTDPRPLAGSDGSRSIPSEDAAGAKSEAVGASSSVGSASAEHYPRQSSQAVTNSIDPYDPGPIPDFLRRSA